MTCFYSSTLWQKYLNSLNFGLIGLKSEPVAVGCKVLPICDIASLGSRSSVGIGGEGMDKDVQKSRKAISWMKELVRWAAAAKTGIKGWKVLYFRNKMAPKDSQDDSSSSSSKLSFRWDLGNCSASSSVFSPLSMPSVSRSDQMWSKNLSTPPVTLEFRL